MHRRTGRTAMKQKTRDGRFMVTSPRNPDLFLDDIHQSHMDETFLTG